MNASSTRQQPREVFVAALKLSPDQWPRLLDDACGDDRELRQRVQELLDAHLEAGSFLVPASPPIASTLLTDAPPEHLGTQIGPYKLLEQIGTGGMGAVYVAEQKEPVRRTVALKVIKPGMDTREVIARFEAERQALAMMNHPNIAKVLDAGSTAAGRPYFVMELVKGTPITGFCDAEQLDTRQRLQLFITVCQAVHHAHQRGLIHRDLKPGNVLVEMHDVLPVPKVIDFGVAKAIGQQLTEKTLHTGFYQMLGTPMYMSPEQAGQSSLDVDTRSDVYSLGVLLYELLTGTTPFDKEAFSKVGLDEVRRIIREDEPARPSHRVSTLAAGKISTVSKNRGLEPRRFAPSLRRELDWIVMKALEKDRSRRYDTPAGLAADIQHFLDDEPVMACPPSNWYRFRKFARRNKSVLATASVVSVAVLLALVTLTASTLLIARTRNDLADALEREQQRLALERRETYFQRISGAYRELSADNLGRALALLEACPEELRDWEWRYLMQICRVDPLIISDETEFSGLAFSPDGERIASACGDGTVKLWNSRTGDLIRSFSAHTDSVVCVAFHPDGRHLASVGFDRLVKVWELTTEKERELFTAPCDVRRKLGTASTVAFSPDGRLLATASEGAVRIWDWKDRQCSPLTLPPHEFHSIPVAFSRDGRVATTAGERSLIHLWEVETGRSLRSIPAHRYPVSALAFSPDGKWLASASYDGSVRLSDATTGAMLPPFEAHTGNVECVAFSPDGKRLASGGEDKTVRIWETSTGREVLGLRGHTGRCCCVAFSPDGLRLASASTDGTIRIADATPLRGDERQEILTFSQHRGAIRTVAISPDDSQRVASAGTDDSVKVWNMQTGRVHAEFRHHAVVVFSVAWQPDGQRIASAGSDGHLRTVMVWNSRTEQEVFELPSERAVGPYTAVAFSPDGRYLVTGRVTGVVHVWDARTGHDVGTLGTHGRAIWGLVFSGDGRHLASSSEGAVKLWDAARLDEEQNNPLTLPARVPGESLNVAFSPDSRRLATGGEENTVIVRDVETGEKLQTLWGKHSGEVYAVAFSPVDDGRWVATAGEDSAVKVWDSNTGKLIHSFRGHTGIVCSLAFNSDGRRLISGSRDKTVKVWDTTKLRDAPPR